MWWKYRYNVLQIAMMLSICFDHPHHLVTHGVDEKNGIKRTVIDGDRDEIYQRRELN